jgi:hypothetical protein
MTNDDIWGEMALFWGNLSLKTAQSEIRTTTNDDNDRILVCPWFSEADSSTLSFFKPTL